MDGYEKDDLPMLLDSAPQLPDGPEDHQFNNFTSRARSSSMSTPSSSVPFEENSGFGFAGPLSSDRGTFIQMSGPLCIRRKPEAPFQPTQVASGKKLEESPVESISPYIEMGRKGWKDGNVTEKNENLMKSGQLGMCNDPYCTTCPSYYKAAYVKYGKASNIFDHKFHNALYGDAKGWARRFCSTVYSFIPGIMNPHTRVVQKWNKFFAISSLLAIFLDPLFFFVLSVLKNDKCIVIDWAMTTTMVVFRSVTDFIYFLHMLLQFRLAYVAPESKVVGSGDLVDQPKKIALHYLSGYFLIDLFAVLPLPQVIILLILSNQVISIGANYAKNLLRAAVLVQYIPRLYRFLPLLSGQSSSGFVFESAWANFVINLLTFVLSGHVVGSCWYLFGLQRVNQCLRNACHHSEVEHCVKFIDCGRGNKNFYTVKSWNTWKNNTDAAACFTEDGFPYGIYQQAVNLTTESSVVTRYVYSFFWGFQQISTLAGNLVPSYFVWEVLFTVAIIGLGLLLFALLIGNMQNFLQSLGRRKLERSLRRRDVEQWMSHRRLPEDLRRKVREAERYNWAATRGVDEERLMENLPEDLQKNIRSHLFEFIKKVPFFSLMEEPVLDAVRARLRQKTYIKGSKILDRSGLIEKIVFIVRGKMQSIGEDGIIPLSEGDVCGEELLTWCLEHSSTHKDGKNIKDKNIKFIGTRPPSNRDVRCLTNVEAFILRAEDLEEVTRHFTRFLRNPRVQGVIRYGSPYWRSLGASRIQVAWRYQKKKRSRAVKRSQSNSSL